METPRVISTPTKRVLRRRKPLVPLLTALVLVASLLLVALSPVPTVRASTNVSGIISSNTTWTAANSPYIVTSAILVNEGVTLTIEPGVEVRFEQDTYLKVEGFLVAIGTESDSIVFTSNLDEPNAQDWTGIIIRPTAGTTLDGDDNYISGSVLDYVTIEYANTGLYVFGTGFLVTHSSFLHNSHAIEIRSTNHVVLENNAFANNGSGIWSIYEDYEGDMVSHIINTKIHDNVFSGNDRGVDLNINQRKFEALDIANNEFSGNNVGIEIGGGGYGPKAHSIFVTRNWIYNNTAGISFPQFYDQPWEDVPEYQVVVQQNMVINNSADPLSIGRTGNVQFLIENNILADNGGGIPLYGP